MIYRQQRTQAQQPHNQRTIHDQQHISGKRFCIASRLADIEKDIPTAYPDITQTVQYRPRSPQTR